MKKFAKHFKSYNQKLQILWNKIKNNSKILQRKFSWAIIQILSCIKKNLYNNLNIIFNEYFSKNCLETAVKSLWKY